MTEKEKLSSSARVIRKLFPFVVICGFAIVIVGVIWIIKSPSVQLKNRPEQTEQVEVIGKRIREHRTGGSKFSPSTTIYYYLITFKLSDGSEKEIFVGRNSQRQSGERKVSCPTYDAIHEGDTGILTFKEIDNMEERYKDENVRWMGRTFLSFEKDHLPKLDD